MEGTVYFESPASWAEARELLTFVPRVPGETLGRPLAGLRVHVRDHKKRDVPIGERSLEAHYGAFVVSQKRVEAAEARRLALEVRYGPAPRPVHVSGHDGRACDLGPEVPPDDPDGRSAAVVTWHDGEMFFLVASSGLDVERLLEVAESL